MRERADCAAAVPTPDHVVPLLFLTGLFVAEGGRPRSFVRGYSMGTMSTACHGLGCELMPEAEAGDAATVPSGVPSDQANK